jgi:carboxylate-amine ligase
VEEELMILERGSWAQVPRVAALVEAAQEAELPGTLKTELFASVVELTTGICTSVPEAIEAIRGLRRFASDAAAGHGLAIAAAGSHPTARPEDQEIVLERRYTKFVSYAGVSARRQGVNGLHVHVGMPSGDACIRTLEWILPWLPVVLALSANSPYLEGRETGLASNRAEVLAQLPRSGAPPPFRSYADWEAFVARFVALGFAPDYTAVWWDVRPHSRLGTLEVRMPDQPTALGRTAGFVALLQALCATALERPPRPWAPLDRWVYQQNRWAALRFAHEGELVHPDGDRLAKVPDLARELIDLVRPAAERLGSASCLDALDPDGCEGDRQLEVGRTQGLAAVCADLVERTVAFDQ